MEHVRKNQTTRNRNRFCQMKSGTPKTEISSFSGSGNTRPFRQWRTWPASPGFFGNLFFVNYWCSSNISIHYSLKHWNNLEWNQKIPAHWTAIRMTNDRSRQTKTCHRESGNDIRQTEWFWSGTSRNIFCPHDHLCNPSTRLPGFRPFFRNQPAFISSA